MLLLVLIYVVQLELADGATGKALIERWETIPMPPKANPIVKDGCYDVQAKKHANGEIYQRLEGKFKYICVDSVEQVYACIGSERTQTAEIPVNGTLHVNRFWHKCTEHPNSTVVYTQEFSCKYKDNEYKVGDEVNLGFLHLRCEQDGYKVEGCFSMDKNSGVVSTAQESGAKERTRCKSHSALQKPADGGCVRSGKTYRDGETFDDTRIKYKCTRGAVDPIGCYTNKNRTLAIGEDIVEDNAVYRCFEIAGRIYYLEYGCGTACHPKPISEGGGTIPIPGGSNGMGRVVVTQP